MTIDSIEASMRQLRGRAEVSIGWGTDLTNDFAGCAPHGSGVDLTPPSLVCKVIEVEGRPAVKLSDNPAKFLGAARRDRPLSPRLRLCGRDRRPA